MKTINQTDLLYQSPFLKACRREKTSQTPIWLMRQAGRYMKEYRAIREKVAFLELCKNSDLASEVTIDAAHRLNVDAAIIFSDILVVLEPLGFKLTYEKNDGPQIHNPFSSSQDLNRLKPVSVSDSLSYVLDAIKKTRHGLKPDLPLIGFVGAPFTLASYAIEGGSSRTFLKTKQLMREDAKTWSALLNVITDVLIEFLTHQIDSGAQAVQIFDSWAGTLSREEYQIFALPYTRRLIQGVSGKAPVINFATQVGSYLSTFKQGGGDVIGVDWRIPLVEAWDQLGDVAVMGNLDPTVLFSSQDIIRQHVEAILKQAQGRPGHIFNLGHGILPNTPVENVVALVKMVKEISQR